MFPFTPHTTLRPDYCSGGSFFAENLRSCLLGTGLRLLAPETGRLGECESGGEEEGERERERERGRVGEFFFCISAFCLRKPSVECLVRSAFGSLLPSYFGSLLRSVKIVDASGYTFC